MNSILYLASILISMSANAADLPESFSINSLDALEAKCPEFGKHVPDAVVIFTCDNDERSLIVAKALTFDGRSYIKDPETHARRIMLDVRDIVHEEFQIEAEIQTCHIWTDSLGRCKRVYSLRGTRDFDEAALAINPIEEKMNSFSYFFILGWHRD
ncbi:hypothetical protein [Rhizobium bangladeshense]|nr:hypothetical protein [Rhizobium bangladeshense]MBX4892009.1 hypothetical protein [Rhizobium bangladeshense]MBX4914047.1 hypothetical protein [Rhizobium bangladeshense]MBX4919651.1 hypothetical protein [Rhizobium bangladeshense]MBX4932061.1 hypothetical protein [Rhizobium bangladeshense]MBY3583848.1 hypothetical protein [Rhizobium bangladeshense]